MDFQLTDQQALIVETARRFVTTHLMPHEENIEQSGEVPDELRHELGRLAREAGLYAANMPESVGGAGLDNVEFALLERELGRVSLALSACVLRPAPILKACRGEQIERYLKPTVAGERIDCFALTEPGAGSDASNIATTAKADGDDFILNGTKHFISHADVADFAIVFAVTGVSDGPRPRKKITAFLVDKGTPGFEVRRMRRAVGNRGYHQCELFFTDCRLPRTQVLGEVDRGFDVAKEWLFASRLAIAANCVGRAERILDMALEWASSRKTFGRPIAEHQGIGFKLADMATELEAARLLTLQLAWKMDRGEATEALVAMAKMYSSEMLGRVADDAVQIFGGMGVMQEMPIERFWRDARVERIWDGTSEIQRHMIARELTRPYKQ
ncbi:acyl-CoA dehydrogenase family protein [Rhodoligotrophos defluvii]|uniref:acyl-CoA dehydrogenase family protein n=1 Tax=Rhodoligotrophos defluvii TaxID=2561934 RepID=UPI0010C955FE|nr:acyl-CoA dehydrogenase family protein [Rhodoligotrophos defluvii]